VFYPGPINPEQSLTIPAFIEIEAVVLISIDYDLFYWDSIKDFTHSTPPLAIPFLKRDRQDIEPALYSLCVWHRTPNRHR
jgi:hypothetical protein